MTERQLHAYLARIGFHGPLEPTAATLRGLHLAHLLSVPFENLSIHVGEPIVLDEGELVEKVVMRRRGGFCYELNGLFAALLRSLGFEVAMLSAGVAGRGGTFGPEFDHMTLRVALAEPWLADVGFGDSFRAPLRLDATDEQVEGRRAYRIDADGERRVLMQRGEDGPWSPQYRFGLEPHALVDYAARCRFHETSPESHFTQNRVCSLATPEGRVTLSGMLLITTAGGERSERQLTDEWEYAEVLRSRFGIVLAS